MQRRTFLKSCAAGLFCSLDFPHALLSAEPAGGSSIRLADLPLLFVDDGGIERSSGVQRVFHPGSTRSEPVLVADRPWERGRVYIYGSALYDEPSRKYRLWYCTPKPGFVCLATSADGLHWEKPALGVIDYKGSAENNIVVEGLSSPSLIFDQRERDPARRYKMIGAREGEYFTHSSPDGIRWTSDSKGHVMKGDDTLTLAQEPLSGDYLLYHKKQIQLRGQLRRTIWLARSSDFRTWSEPALAFAADTEDDRWATGDQRTDVYDMAVIPHAAGYFGLPAMFQVARVRPKETLAPNQAGDDGRIAIQLVTSADGKQWRHPSERIDMIPLGAHGGFDLGAMLGVANQLVHSGDETWLYYTALNTTHGAPIPPKQLTIGRAGWRLHGLASLVATGSARIETRPVRLENNRISVNASALAGSVRIGLLDEASKALPGFELEACDPLTADQTRWTPSWKGNAAVPTDRPVRIVVEMTNASLFSISAARG